MRNVSGRILQASDDERAGIAHELHGDLGQRLSLLAIDLDSLLQEMRKSDDKNQAVLSECLDQLNAIISSVHSLSQRLHSSKIGLLGLAPTLRDLSAQTATKHDIGVEFENADDGAPIDGSSAQCMYQVARAALRWHVEIGATKIQLHLGNHLGALRLLTKDTGPVQAVRQVTKDTNIVTMRERLRLCGGELLVNSAPQGGNEIVAEIPAQDSKT